jgi:hypothetical protein
MNIAVNIMPAHYLDEPCRFKRGGKCPNIPWENAYNPGYTQYHRKPHERESHNLKQNKNKLVIPTRTCIF